MPIAGSLLVDEVLQDAGVEHRHGRDDEAEGDARDGAEGDAVFLQEGVDESVEYWREEEDGDGVEVLH